MFPKIFLLLPLLLSCLLLPVQVRAGSMAEPCRVLAQYPHDPSTSTQGLFLYRGRLFESSGGYGRSFVAEVDLATGAHKQRADIGASYFAEGMAPCGDSLRLLTWKSGMGFILSLDGLRETGRFPYRKTFEHTGGWGLTSDGKQFILSTGQAQLRFHNLNTFALERTVEVTDRGRPVHLLNELEYVHGLIYANIWKRDRIAIINPASGAVEAWLDLSPLRASLSPESGVANGIAWDPKTDTLLVTGKHWNRMFRIAVPTFRCPAAQAFLR